MKTLMEIVESARDGHMPTQEECYWAMLALNALHTFDQMDIGRIIEKPRFAGMWHEESFQRAKRCFSTSPKHWVGKNNDPANPEFQERRRLARKIVQHVERIAMEEKR